MDTKQILANVTKHISLEQAEANYFVSLLNERDVKKKELLLKAGEPCTTFNFVNSGTLRAFFRDDQEKESTIMFAVSDWWITDMPCFVSQAPAMISIEAIADCSVLQLSYVNMNTLFENIPKFERFFRILMQNAYVREQLRVLQNLSLPAEVRYNNFASKYPMIIQQVTQKHIASYLGITPEFLSVIRSKVRKG